MIDVGPIPLLADDRRRDRATRSSATWTRSCTSASTAATWRSARTPTGRSSSTPTTSPRSRSRRSRRPSCRSPPDDFDPQLEQALELMPDILGDEPGIKLRDQRPAVADARRRCRCSARRPRSNLWSAAAVWIKEGPGIGQLVAEWMTHGESEIDPHGSDIARFYDAPADADARPGARAPRTSTRPTASSTRASSGRSNRDVRAAPVPRARARARRGLLRGRRLGAPALVRVQRAAARASTAIGSTRREAEWDVALVVADHQRRAPRHARARRRWSTSRRSRSSTSAGPGALDYLQQLAVEQMRRARRARRLHAAARRGRRLPRRPHDHAARRRALPRRHRRRMGMARPEWFRDHLPADGSAQLADRTSALCTIGVWGPRARDVVASIDRRDDVSHDGLPVRHLPRRSRSARLRVARVAHLVRRRARLGDLRPDGARPAALGHALGGRPGARHRRRSASACTARPAGSRRATGSWRRAGAASTTRSRPAWPGRRSRRPTSSARRPTSRQRRGAAGRDPVHADGRRPHVAERRRALHARAASRS